MLGAQANNSSNYPAMLPKVWPIIRAAPRQYGRDARRVGADRAGRGPVRFLLARHACCRRRAQNEVRLVLLWFGTWKNTGPSYTPEWVKSDTTRFPRMITRDGQDPLCPVAASAARRLRPTATPSPR